MLERAHALRTRGEPFALATVVRAERPSSAKPGMKAIVRADGTLEGWVGGSCAHPVVVREALRLLSEGRPGLIGLSPPGQAGPRAGVIYHPMTCHSGGSLEIYVEPVLPPPRLLLVGEAPLVRALAQLGRLEEFAVFVAAPGKTEDPPEGTRRVSIDQLKDQITPHTYVVVATMGAYDEEALERVGDTPAAYVGLVASRKRAEAVFAYLRERGLAETPLRRIKVPAGLDIGAVTPEEIAVSIMAEIIQVRHRDARVGVGQTAPASPAGQAVDPICGMTVETATARHFVEYRGARFYFCSAHCRQTFERDPVRYVTAEA